MKKLLTLAAILALALTACEQPVDDSGQTTKLPSLTIRNESSFVLTNVTFSREYRVLATIFRQLFSSKEKLK